eukprot:TRINITY_DN28547_c0_g1_i1.p1 TRINITY_DN28547_c0_g1~~TRINITY_DN28547_c0_g1_i1.p1  ORF type:complete len:571 (+),score=112.30 TRINITY_DN28547_c0_g1_i1:244-1956(+)
MRWRRRRPYAQTHVKVGVAAVAIVAVLSVSVTDEGTVPSAEKTCKAAPGGGDGISDSECEIGAAGTGETKSDAGDHDIAGAVHEDGNEAKVSGNKNASDRQAPVSMNRPCGCTGASTFATVAAEKSIACVKAASDLAPATDDGIVVVTFVPQHTESFGRYSLPLTAAHLATFGHALRLERSSGDEESVGVGRAYHETIFEGDVKDNFRKVTKIRSIVKELQKQRRESSSQALPQWLLLLPVDAAIVTNKDVLRRTLLSSLIDKKTHVIVSRRGHGRHVEAETRAKKLDDIWERVMGNSTNNTDAKTKTKSKSTKTSASADPLPVRTPLLDSGVLFLRIATWTDGFLVAWLRELSAAGSRKPRAKSTKDQVLAEAIDAGDEALERAVQRARRLGGPTAVVELPPKASLSADFQEVAFASVRKDPVVRLRLEADEVREAFFQSAWAWACNRPGGLWGGAPAILQRLHWNALQTILKKVLESASNGMQLRRGGVVLHRSHQAEALMDFVGSYSPHWFETALNRSRQGAPVESSMEVFFLRLCASGYAWIGVTKDNNVGARRCFTALNSLNALR